MDFSSRVGQSRQQQPVGHTGAAAAVGQGGGASTHSPSKKRVIGGPRWFRVTIVGLLACVAILVIAIAASFYINGQGEAKYIDASEYQAVFLNSGQVYFGKIKTLDNQFVDLQNIFYLSTQQAQPANAKTSSAGNKFSLVKLGCELHGPVDQMLINKGQVTFWENLRNNGQVVTAINKWYQQNPNGLQCNNPAS